MPDLHEGTPGMETPETTGTIPTPTQTAESVPGDTQPITDPRYAGKSPAELVGILNEREKMVGKLGERLGTVDALKAELDDLRNQIRQSSEQPRYAPPPPMEPPVQFDYTNPDAYIEAKLSRERQKLAQSFGQYQAEQRQRENAYYFNNTKNIVVKQNKPLFDGIEKDVEGFMWQAAQTSPEGQLMIRDPNQWVQAARLIRFQREEWDKIMPQKQSGMTAPSSETPGRTAKALPDDDDIVLSEDDRRQMEEDGLTEKEALEAIKVGRDMKRKGTLKGGGR